METRPDKWFARSSLLTLSPASSLICPDTCTESIDLSDLLSLLPPIYSKLLEKTNKSGDTPRMANWLEV